MTAPKRVTPLQFAGGASGLLTTAEAADYMGVPQRRVRAMCRDRDIECWWNGLDGASARYKVHRDTVAAWLREHTVKAVAA